MKKKYILFALAVILIVPLLSGCIELVPVTVRGGGWVPVGGIEPESVAIEAVECVDKATFGFTVKSYNIVEDEGEFEYEVKGEFLYIDHANNVRIKGKVLAATFLDGAGVLGGEYTVDGITGSFSVAIFDNGEPGADDEFYISITDGVYDGYVNGGVIGGGNVKIF